MSKQWKLTFKREGEAKPRSGNPVGNEWKIHEKVRFLLEEADPHYLCDHYSGEYRCLGDIEWVRIDERDVSEWRSSDPIYRDRASRT